MSNMNITYIPEVMSKVWAFCNTLRDDVIGCLKCDFCY